MENKTNGSYIHEVKIAGQNVPETIWIFISATTIHYNLTSWFMNPLIFRSTGAAELTDPHGTALFDMEGGDEDELSFKCVYLVSTVSIAD